MKSKIIFLFCFSLIFLSRCYQVSTYNSPTYYRRVLQNIRSYHHKTLANKILHDFPNEIPGAQGVYKFETPGAKYCLVHIMDAHGSPFASESDFYQVEKFQNNVYKIISELIKTFPNYLDMIFVEESEVAFDQESIDNESEMKDFLVSIDKELDSLIIDRYGYVSNETIRDKQKVSRFFIDMARSQERLDNISAINRLARDYQLKLIPADKEDAVDWTYDIVFDDLFVKSTGLKKSSNLENMTDDQMIDFWSDLLDNREDFLIAKMISFDRPLVVTVFGGGHELFDNVNSWNSQHESEQASLILIYPEDKENYFFESR